MLTKALIILWYQPPHGYLSTLKWSSLERIWMIITLPVVDRSLLVVAILVLPVIISKILVKKNTVAYSEKSLIATFNFLLDTKTTKVVFFSVRIEQYHKNFITNILSLSFIIALNINFVSRQIRDLIWFLIHTYFEWQQIHRCAPMRGGNSCGETPAGRGRTGRGAKPSPTRLPSGPMKPGCIGPVL